MHENQAKCVTLDKPVLLIHQILNSNIPKVYQSNARHHFYINSPSLVLRPLLYFQKYFKCGNKSEIFSVKGDS